MANCMICKKPVTSAYVVCTHCAESLKHKTLSPEMARFIDHLANTVVSDEKINACALCAVKTCKKAQQETDTCRNAVKAWLLLQAQDCFRELEDAV